MTLLATWALPRVFVADDGEPRAPLDGLATGTFLRDLDLPALVSRASTIDPPWGLDVDSIRGLHPDEAAARFVIGRLGASVVVSRRPAVLRAACDEGAIGLLAVQAFDSTGLRRVVQHGPLPEGVGCLVSPGLVLPHLRADELAALPRPLVGHGLITRPNDARACLDLADAIVVRRDAARHLAMAMRGGPQPATQTLTSIRIEE